MTPVRGGHQRARAGQWCAGQLPNDVTLTTPVIYGKEGVAGSIPAGGSKQQMTSGNAGHRRAWGLVRLAA
jgi:hypothetical protein